MARSTSVKWRKRLHFTIVFPSAILAFYCAYSYLLYPDYCYMNMIQCISSCSFKAEWSRSANCPSAPVIDLHSSLGQEIRGEEGVEGRGAVVLVRVRGAPHWPAPETGARPAEAGHWPCVHLTSTGAGHLWRLGLLWLLTRLVLGLANGGGVSTSWNDTS